MVPAVGLHLDDIFACLENLWIRTAVSIQQPGPLQEFVGWKPNCIRLATHDELLLEIEQKESFGLIVGGLHGAFGFGNLVVVADAGKPVEEVAFEPIGHLEVRIWSKLTVTGPVMAEIGIRRHTIERR